jgi:hypothetical protein
MAVVNLTTFTEENVADWFATRDITKARPYVDLVYDLEISGSQISARIPGTAAEPYTAQAYLSQAQSGEMAVVSRCTCTTGKHCKHVAAMLLKAIEERNPKEQVSGSALSWLDDLRRVSVAVAKKKARPASARQQLFYILKWTADRRQFAIEIRKGKYPESAEEWWKVDRALVTPPQFVTEEDLSILRLIWTDRVMKPGCARSDLAPRTGRKFCSAWPPATGSTPKTILVCRSMRALPARPASAGRSTEWVFSVRS